MAGIADTLERWGTAASSSKIGGILYHVVCRRIDTVLIPLTKGRLSMGPPGNTVLITTTGARSGKPRKASLAFMWHGDDMVIIASKGGAPHHPAWYHNLKADPRVVVQTRAGVEDRVAREAVGEERDKLFEAMATTYSNFAAYQARATERKIPVMVLSPITA
ncbi:MAG: nitroreductase family deazaflavin-dependent oxidoreductase [bacterium]|nr:nitroreductase family deazaflavin-dependent oxidoreductase [bacterium]